MNILHLINKYPDKPWDWSAISENKNITMTDILKNADKPWNWSNISKNSNIIMTDILENADKPWEWSGISYYANITMADILAYAADKPWDWSGISINSNITISFIENNIDKINFKQLSYNTFVDKKPFLKILLNIIHYDVVSIILGYL